MRVNMRKIYEKHIPDSDVIESRLAGFIKLLYNSDLVELLLIRMYHTTEGEFTYSIEKDRAIVSCFRNEFIALYFAGYFSYKIKLAIATFPTKEQVFSVFCYVCAKSAFSSSLREIFLEIGNHVHEHL